MTAKNAASRKSMPNRRGSPRICPNRWPITVEAVHGRNITRPLPSRKPASGRRPSLIFAHLEHPVAVAEDREARIDLPERQRAEMRPQRRAEQNVARVHREHGEHEREHAEAARPTPAASPSARRPHRPTRSSARFRRPTRPFEAASRPTPRPKAISVGEIRIPLRAPSTTPCHVKVGVCIHCASKPAFFSSATCFGTSAAM